LPAKVLVINDNPLSGISQTNQSLRPSHGDHRL
jgi:hypothetical protein